MAVFHMDLDNTIIYSYKRDIGPEKVNVEIYQGRKISFITKKTYEMLVELNRRLLLVPTTTRTIEQYERIRLPIGTPKYALVCNGGILLVDGVEDQSWYEESLSLISDTRTELEKAYDALEKEKRREFELRFIRELFLFTKCSEPESVVAELQKILNPDLVKAFHNGSKVYVIPGILEKGHAVNRLKKYLMGKKSAGKDIGVEKVIAAGDSEFDISMLNAADTAIAPKELQTNEYLSPGTVFMPGDQVFSEELLRYVLQLCYNMSTIHKTEYSICE